MENELTAVPPSVSAEDCPLQKQFVVQMKTDSGCYTTHIWQEYLDIVEDVRKTDLGKRIYARRKETIERVFADAKEKHAMRYTHHRGLTRVSAWVRLKYAAMNLKKLALWKWSRPDFFVFLPYFFFDTTKTPALA